MLLALTGAILCSVAAAAIFFGRQRPDAAAALEARLPAPQTWTRLSSARETAADLPLEGEFRAMAFESPAVTDPGAQTSTITVRVPVSAEDCDRLEAQVGGGCGSPTRPLVRPERLGVQSLGAPLEGFMHLKGSGTFELTQSGAGDSTQPIEWTLAGRAPQMTLEIACVPGDRLLLTGPAGSAPASCGRFGAGYVLDSVAERDNPPRIHLNGVHWLRLRLLGDAAKVTVDEGKMILGPSSEPVVSPEPEPISIRSKAPHLVSLKVEDPLSGAPHTSIRTSRRYG